jgi:hypothetical protein
MAKFSVTNLGFLGLLNSRLGAKLSFCLFSISLFYTRVAMVKPQPLWSKEKLIILMLAQFWASSHAWKKKKLM